MNGEGAAPDGGELRESEAQGPRRAGEGPRRALLGGQGPRTRGGAPPPVGRGAAPPRGTARESARGPRAAGEGLRRALLDGEGAQPPSQSPARNLHPLFSWWKLMRWTSDSLFADRKSGV